MKKYTLNDRTMTDLEEYSSKTEMFAKFAEHISNFVCQKIINSEYDDETLYELGSLTEMFADLAASYDSRLSNIIKNIKIDD